MAARLSKHRKLYVRPTPWVTVDKADRGAQQDHDCALRAGQTRDLEMPSAHGFDDEVQDSLDGRRGFCRSGESNCIEDRQRRKAISCRTNDLQIRCNQILRDDRHRQTGLNGALQPRSARAFVGKAKAHAALLERPQRGLAIDAAGPENGERQRLAQVDIGMCRASPHERCAAHPSRSRALAILRNERQIDVASVQGIERLPASIAMKFDVDHRIVDVKPFENARHVAHGYVRRPDPDPARWRLPAHLDEHLIGQPVHALRKPQQYLPFLGQLDAPPAPFEQANLKRFFETLDLHADRGLNAVEPLGGACDVLGLGNHTKRLQERAVDLGRNPIHLDP